MQLVNVERNILKKFVWAFIVFLTFSMATPGMAAKAFTEEMCAGYSTFAKCNDISVSKPGSCAWKTEISSCVAAYKETDTTTTVQATTTETTKTKGGKK